MVCKLSIRGAFIKNLQPAKTVFVQTDFHAVEMTGGNGQKAVAAGSKKEKME
jgi:hypothetical protein